MAGAFEHALVRPVERVFGRPRRGVDGRVLDRILVKQFVVGNPGQTLDYLAVLGHDEIGDEANPIGLRQAHGLDHQRVAFPARDRISQRSVVQHFRLVGRGEGDDARLIAIFGMDDDLLRAGLKNLAWVQTASANICYRRYRHAHKASLPGRAFFGVVVTLGDRPGLGLLASLRSVRQDAICRQDNRARAPLAPHNRQTLGIFCDLRQFGIEAPCGPFDESIDHADRVLTCFLLRQHQRHVRRPFQHRHEVAGPDALKVGMAKGRLRCSKSGRGRISRPWCLRQTRRGQAQTAGNQDRTRYFSFHDSSPKRLVSFAQVLPVGTASGGTKPEWMLHRTDRQPDLTAQNFQWMRKPTQAIALAQIDSDRAWSKSVGQPHCSATQLSVPLGSAHTHHDYDGAF